MESHAKRCLQHHVWHGIPSQSDPKLGLTWNSMSIPWGHFPCQMQHFDVSWCISIWHGMPCQIDATAHIQFWHGTPCQIWHGFYVKRLDTEFHVKECSRSVRERFCIDLTRDPLSKGNFKGWGWGKVFCLQLGPQTESNRSRNWPPKQLRKRGW